MISEEAKEEELLEEDFERWAKVPASLMRDKRLTKNDILVYSYLNMVQGKKEKAFPYVNSISKYLGIFRSSVSKSINRLKQYNWIEVKDRGGKKSNVYITLNQPYSIDFEVKTKRGRNLKLK